MENGVITVEQLKKQFGEFEDTTAESRALSEKCRDYRDLKQWTPDQLAELQRRKQAPFQAGVVAAHALPGRHRQSTPRSS